MSFSTLISRSASRRLARLVNRSSATTLRRSVISTNHVKQLRTFSTSNDMFCFQCEQTQDGTGCTTVGVCGKEPTTAAVQDAIVFVVKGVSMYAELARSLNVPEEQLGFANDFTLEAMFSTLTNVNFDDDALVKFVQEGLEIRQRLQQLCQQNGASADQLSTDGGAVGPQNWTPASFDVDTIKRDANQLMGVEHRRETYGEDVAGLQEMIVYGAKGAAAYGHHALRAGGGDSLREGSVAKELHAAMAVVGRGEKDVNTLVGAALGVGGTNLTVLKALDGAHCGRFGDPVPTPVNHSPVEGKCILVSGHDLHDLETLLKQSAGQGVNVYTHGEMLPAHGYPELKAKYPHLVGHYGGPWQLQKFEFSKFPGPIVMTTNCLMEPRKQYKERLFTAGVTGWPGCKHIQGGEEADFGPVIAMAKEMDGFKETKPEVTTLTGFGHKTVLGVADKVLDAVNQGNLQRIVLIGGCDGAESERSYYTTLGTNLPDESLILTLGCGKFRLLGKKDYGNLPGTEIPRLLDMGQCNDSYSAVAVAVALADVLKTDVNSLPLSIVLSWFEQKAVAVLLTLLHLGVKDIRVGPNLPAFVTPAVLQVLQDNFNLMPVHGPNTPAAQIVDEVMKQ